MSVPVNVAWWEIYGEVQSTSKAYYESAISKSRKIHCRRSIP